MPDRIPMACPNCGHSLKVPPEYVGKVGSCKKCGHTFTIRVPDQRALNPVDLPTLADPEVAGKAEIERLERENNDLRTERDGLKDQLESRPVEHPEPAPDPATSAQFERLQQENGDLRAECDRLTDRLTMLRSDHEALSQTQALLAVAQEALATLQTEHDRLIEDRAADQTDRTTLIAEWTARWEEARARADQAETGTEALRKQLDEVEGRAASERSRLESEREQARNEYAEIETEVARLTKELADERERVEALRHQSELDAVSFQDRSQALEDKHSQHDTARLAMEAELETLRTKVQTIQGELNFVKSSRDQMTRTLEGLGIRFPD